MSNIEIEETDTTVTLSLNRPDKRNALNVEVAQELSDQLAALHKDATKGIFLRGNGPVTCAGADTAIVQDGTEEENRRFRELIEEIYERMNSYPRPTVMACKGAAAGAGFQLMVTCDFTILGEETTIYKPEIEFGLFSEYATKMIEHEAGTDVAKEVTLTGQTIEPERARSLGLVRDVVPNSKVEGVARELLSKLVGYDPTAYEMAKDSLRFQGSPSDFGGYP